MIQFECPRVIYPLVLFTFGVHCGVPFSQYAGKGKCCMWPVNKVEIPVSKIGFVDSKRSNLNAPGSYTPWYHNSFGVHYRRYFPLHAGKGKYCMNLGLVISWLSKRA